MAKGNGNPTSGLSLYGKGTETQERNPFMPLEKSYDGGSKGVVSNRGSNFTLDLHKDSEVYERLEGKKDRGLSGKTTESLEVNDEPGSGKRNSAGSH